MEHSMANKRQSGIELLKIIGIFLIVLYHVNLELGLSTPGPTNNLGSFFYNLIEYSGKLGNCIFFICSAYFFC